MEIPALLKNKWVIIGGVGFGLVILMTRGTAAAPSPSSPSGMIALYNTAAIQSNLAQNQIDATVTNARLATSTQQVLGLLSFLNSKDQTQHVADVQMAQVDAGITSLRITSVQTVLNDQENFLSKLAMTYQGASVATHVSDNSLKGIQAQAAATMSAAHDAAEASKFSAVAGGISGVIGSLAGAAGKIFSPVK